jgi:hypothetical protein
MTMTCRIAVAAALASVIAVPGLHASALAEGQPASAVLGGGMLSVRNNTRQPLTCAEKDSIGSWSRWFVIPAGGEWTDSWAFGRAEMQCRPPVRQVRYSLDPGKRYSFLPSARGGIELVDIGE